MLRDILIDLELRRADSLEASRRILTKLAEVRFPGNPGNLSRLLLSASEVISSEACRVLREDHLPIDWNAVEDGFGSRWIHVRSNVVRAVCERKYAPLADKAVVLVYEENTELFLAGAQAALTFRRTDVLPRVRTKAKDPDPDIVSGIGYILAELEKLARQV
jgi:hypothetical protein